MSGLRPCRPATAVARLRRQVPAPVAEVVARLAARRGAPLWVGGAVRDAVLGARCHDWDLATSLSPAEVAGLFPRVLRHAMAHGMVVVRSGGLSIEVSTLRGGAGGPAARLAGPAAVLADLARRDFSINAMAADPATGNFFDPFNGRQHLAEGVLAAAGGAAARLSEDPLRALRAARFVGRWGLRPDPPLAAALAAVDLQGVALERQRSELAAIWGSPHLAEAMAQVAAIGRRRHGGGPLAPLQSTPARLWPQMAQLPPRQPAARQLMWAHLRALSPAAAAAWGSSWCTSGRQAAQLVAGLAALSSLMGRPATSVPAAWLRPWVAEHAPPAALAAARVAACLRPAAHRRLPARVAAFCRRGPLTPGALALGGAWLRAQGLPPASVGQLLAALHAWVLESPARNRPAALRARLAALLGGSTAG